MEFDIYVSNTFLKLNSNKSIVFYIYIYMHTLPQ